MTERRFDPDIEGFLGEDLTNLRETEPPSPADEKAPEPRAGEAAPAPAEAAVGQPVGSPEAPPDPEDAELEARLRWALSTPSDVDTQAKPDVDEVEQPEHFSPPPAPPPPPVVPPPAPLAPGHRPGRRGAVTRPPRIGARPAGGGRVPGPSPDSADRRRRCQHPRDRNPGRGRRSRGRPAREPRHQPAVAGTSQADGLGPPGLTGRRISADSGGAPPRLPSHPYLPPSPSLRNHKQTIQQ